LAHELFQFPHSLFMNNIVLILIYPLMLGKVKPYQNLAFIISCVSCLIIFTLSWFDNDKNIALSHTIAFLMVLSCVSIISFVLLSLPFWFSKRTEIATIINGVLFLNIEQKPAKYDLKQVKFLLNIDSNLLDNNNLYSQTTKNLKTWRNYIVVPSENPLKDMYTIYP
jgi:hypothetical protein